MSVIVAEPEVYNAFAACDTVIVVVPRLTIVTTLPDVMVATLVFDDEYENATGLLELGSNVNVSPITFLFVTEGKLVITVVINGKYNAIPLELIPSPPYRLYVVPLIVAAVNFVYILFVSSL